MSRLDDALLNKEVAVMNDLLRILNRDAFGTPVTIRKEDNAYFANSLPVGTPFLGMSAREAAATIRNRIDIMNETYRWINS